MCNAAVLGYMNSAVLVGYPGRNEDHMILKRFGIFLPMLIIRLHLLYSYVTLLYVISPVSLFSQNLSFSPNIFRTGDISV